MRSHNRGLSLALAAGLVRPTLDEFGKLDPIDLFTSGCNVGLDEGAERAG